MDLSISEQQELLLFKACKDRGGTLPVKLAEDMYSSKSSGRGALDKLRLAGFIEFKTPGYFKVVKLPRGVKEELERVEEADDDESSDEGDESEWVAEPV